MLKKLLKKQSGFTLVTAMLVSALVLLVGSVVIYKLSNSSKDMVRDKKIREVTNVAEEGMSSFVDYVYKMNTPNYPQGATDEQKAQIKKNLANTNADKFLLGAAFDSSNPYHQQAVIAFKEIGVALASPLPGSQPNPTPTPSVTPSP